MKPKTDEIKSEEIVPAKETYMAPTVYIGRTNTKIGKYFTHKEVVKSYTADRFGVDNNVYNEEVFLNATALAENLLDVIRERFGSFSPNSWYRSEALEYNICKDSFIKWCKDRAINHEAPDAWASYFSKKQHPKGAAADIEVPGIDNDALFAYIKNNLEFDQLIREFRKEGDPTSGWVHVSWDRFGNNRKQAFSIG